jgi:dTDP-glucose pyrophosphorylase
MSLQLKINYSFTEQKAPAHYSVAGVFCYLNVIEQLLQIMTNNNKTALELTYQPNRLTQTGGTMSNASTGNRGSDG